MGLCIYSELKTVSSQQVLKLYSKTASNLVLCDIHHDPDRGKAAKIWPCFSEDYRTALLHCGGLLNKFALSFNCFTESHVSFVTDQSDNVGFGFMALS